MVEQTDSTPAVSGDVIFQRVSDGAILLSTDGEVYYGLNEVGARIWEGLEAAQDTNAICAALEDRYPGADPEQIRSDVDELVDELVREGLVTRSHDDPGSGESGV